MNSLSFAQKDRNKYLRRQVAARRKQRGKSAASHRLSDVQRSESAVERELKRRGMAVTPENKLMAAAMLENKQLTHEDANGRMMYQTLQTLFKGYSIFSNITPVAWAQKGGSFIKQWVSYNS